MATSRQNEADLIAYLAEVDRRELYLEQGCSCMFRYCTEVLHFSEATAFRRIRVARAARAYPLLLERICEGAIHLSGANLLAPALNPENHVELLDLARHKSRRAIEVILADRAPKPDVPARVRKLRESRPAVTILTPPETGGPPCERSSRESAVSTPVPHTGGDQAGSRCAGRRSLCIRRGERPPLQLTRLSRVPSSGPVGQGEAALDRPYRAALSGAQPLRGGAGLWG